MPRIYRSFFSEQGRDFCVEGNQIYVKVKYKLDIKKKELYLYLIMPADLGRGGLRLPWDSYSRKKPIATIDISKLKNNQIHLKWNGFYEKRTKQIDDYGKDYKGGYHKETIRKKETIWSKAV